MKTKTYFPGYHQNEKGEIRLFETEDDMPKGEKWNHRVKWESVPSTETRTNPFDHDGGSLPKKAGRSKKEALTDGIDL